MNTDPSFCHTHRLCLNTLYVLPFYSACSDSPGKKSPCRRQMERFSLRLDERQEKSGGKRHLNSMEQARQEVVPSKQYIWKS